MCNGLNEHEKVDEKTKYDFSYELCNNKRVAVEMEMCSQSIRRKKN